MRNIVIIFQALLFYFAFSTPTGNGQLTRSQIVLDFYQKHPYIYRSLSVDEQKEALSKVESIGTPDRLALEKDDIKDFLSEFFQNRKIPESFQELEHELNMQPEAIKDWMKKLISGEIRQNLDVFQDMEDLGFMDTDISTTNDIGHLKGTADEAQFIFWSGANAKDLHLKLFMQRHGYKNSVVASDIFGMKMMIMLGNVACEFIEGDINIEKNKIIGLMGSYYAALATTASGKDPIYAILSDRPTLGNYYMMNEFPILDAARKRGAINDILVLHENVIEDIDDRTYTNIPFEKMEDLELWNARADFLPASFNFPSEELPQAGSSRGSTTVSQNLSPQTHDNSALLDFPKDNQVDGRLILYNLVPRKLQIQGQSTQWTIIATKAQPPADPSDQNWVFGLYSDKNSPKIEIHLQSLPDEDPDKIHSLVEQFYTGVTEFLNQKLHLMEPNIPNLVTFKINDMDPPKVEYISMDAADSVVNLCRRASECTFEVEGDKSFWEKLEENRALEESLQSKDVVEKYQFLLEINNFFKELKINTAQQLVPLFSTICKVDNEWQVEAIERNNPLNRKILKSNGAILEKMKSIIDPSETAHTHEAGISSISSQESDSSVGFSLYFIYQYALDTYHRMSLKSEIESGPKGWKIPMLIQYAANSINILQDGAHKVKYVKSIIRELTTNPVSVEGRSSSLLSKAMPRIGIGLDAVMLGMSIWKRVKVVSEVDRVNTKTEIAISSSTLLLDGAALGSEFLGLESASAFLGPLAIPLIGVSIGLTPLFNNIGQLKERVKLLGEKFHNIKEAYQNKGFFYNNTVHILIPLNEAVIKSLQIEETRIVINFDSQYIDSSAHRFMTRKIFRDQSKALNIRQLANLAGETVYMELESTLEHIYLPSTPVTYMHYNYQWIYPGFRGRNYRGLDVLRLLESTHKFAVTYGHALRYVIDHVTEEFQQTSIQVELKRRVSSLIIPKLPQTANYMNFISYKIIGNGGECYILLNKVGKISLSEKSTGSTKWHLDTSEMDADTLSLNGPDLRIGALDISINDIKDGIIFVKMKNQQVWKISNGALSLIAAYENHRDIASMQSFLDETFSKNHLQQKLIYIPDHEIGRTRVGAAYYDGSNHKWYYSAGLDIGYTEQSHLIVYGSKQVFFFNQEKLAFWVNDLNHNFKQGFQFVTFAHKRTQISSVLGLHNSILIVVQSDFYWLGNSAEITFIFDGSSLSLARLHSDKTNYQRFTTCQNCRNSIETEVPLLFEPIPSKPWTDENKVKLTLAPLISVDWSVTTGAQIASKSWIRSDDWKHIIPLPEDGTNNFLHDLNLVGSMVNQNGTETFFFYHKEQQKLYKQIGANLGEKAMGLTLSLQNVERVEMMPKNPNFAISAYVNGVQYGVGTVLIMPLGVYIDWFDSTRTPTLQKLENLVAEGAENLFPVNGCRLTSNNEKAKSIPVYFASSAKMFIIGNTPGSTVPLYIGMFHENSYSLFFDAYEQALYKSKLISFNSFLNWTPDVTHDGNKFHLRSTENLEWEMMTEGSIKLIGLYAQTNEPTNDFIKELIRKYSTRYFTQEFLAVHLPNGRVLWYDVVKNILGIISTTADEFVGINMPPTSHTDVTLYAYDSERQEAISLKENALSAVCSSCEIRRTSSSVLMLGNSDDQPYLALDMKNVSAKIMATKAANSRFMIDEIEWSTITIFQIYFDPTTAVLVFIYLPFSAIEHTKLIRHHSDFILHDVHYRTRFVIYDAAKSDPRSLIRLKIGNRYISLSDIAVRARSIVRDEVHEIKLKSILDYVAHV